jgi:hypothetical protein
MKPMEKSPATFWKYYLIAALTMTVVDFTTTFFPDYRRWFGYMPAIFVFYLGLPLVFSFFAVRLRFDGWRLLAVAVAAGIILELTLFHNMMLLTFPIMLIAVPALVAIYGLIMFLPKWLSEGTLGENRGKAAVLVAGWLIVAVITFLSNYH